MDDLLTTLYDHYHVPFVDRRLGNIIERDHQKLIKELSNRQRKLVLEIIDCKDSLCGRSGYRRFQKWLPFGCKAHARIEYL